MEEGDCKRIYGGEASVFFFRTGDTRSREQKRIVYRVGAPEKEYRGEIDENSTSKNFVKKVTGNEKPGSPDFLDGETRGTVTDGYRGDAASIGRRDQRMTTNARLGAPEWLLSRFASWYSQFCATVQCFAFYGTRRYPFFRGWRWFESKLCLWVTVMIFSKSRVRLRGGIDTDIKKKIMSQENCFDKIRMLSTLNRKLHTLANKIRNVSGTCNCRPRWSRGW